MKSILLPIDQSEQMPPSWRLPGCWRTCSKRRSRAWRCDRPSPRSWRPTRSWPSPFRLPIGTRPSSAAACARRSMRSRPGIPPKRATVRRFRWRGGSAVEDGALGSLGRVYDVTVLGRPGGRGARMTALEAALFDSGRPVLMAPPVRAEDIWRDGAHSLERQHRDCALHAVCHADPEKGQAGVADRRGGAMSPGPSVKDARVTWPPTASTPRTRRSPARRLTGGRGHSRRGGSERCRSADQGRLHAEPVAADDLRRRDQPHPGGGGTAGVLRALEPGRSFDQLAPARAVSTRSSRRLRDPRTWTGPAAPRQWPARKRRCSLPVHS